MTNNEIIQLGNFIHSTGRWTNPIRGRVYSIDGISPTLNVVSGGGQEPKVLVCVEDKCNDGKMLSEDEIALRDYKYGLCDDYSYCLDANYWKGGSFEQSISKHRRQMVIERYMSE